MITSEDAFKEVYENDTLTLSPSSFGTIQECFQKGLWNVGFRRVPDYSNFDQQFGRILHGSLDIRQRGFDKDPKELLSEIENYIEAEYAKFDLPDEEYRHSGRAKELAGLYAQHYADDNTRFETVGSEVREVRELGKVVLWRGTLDEREVTIRVQGIADGIWRDRDTGNLCVKDTKTSKSDRTEHKFYEYKMSVQFKLYCWLFSEVYRQKIRDVVVDLIVCRKPLSRVTPKSLPREVFERFNLTYSDLEIERQCDDVLNVSRDFLENCLKEDHAAMTGAPRSCVWPTRCPYYDVCDNDKDEDKLKWLGTQSFKDKQTTV